MARTQTILVVDDEPCARYLLEFVLGKTGCAIVTADHAAEALAIAGGRTIHLLVTDVIMKGMDGFELADTLRRLPQYAELPVIMLSARSQVQHRTEAADGDKNVLLTKPFSPIELTAHVNRLLKL